MTFENLKRLRHLIREALTPKERNMDPKSNAKLAGIMKRLGLPAPGTKKATADVDRESLSAFVERTLGAPLEPWARELLDRTAAELEAHGRGLRATVEVRPLRALSQAELLEAQGFAKLKRPPARFGRPQGTADAALERQIDAQNAESYRALRDFAEKHPAPSIRAAIFDEPAGLQALDPESRERLAIALNRHAPGPVKLTVLKRAEGEPVEIVWGSPPCENFSKKKGG